ncbi:upstream activation factor subunit Uaf30p [Diutina catenulata]
MSEYEPAKYIPTIDAILSVADLEQITVNKIRGALQELFGVDLSTHKKDIKAVILERFEKMDEIRQEKEERERLREIERSDALLAAKLASDGARPSRNGAAAKRAKKEKPKKERSEKQAASSPFNKEKLLSHELAEVLGVSSLSRPQVVKQLWAYIKANDLQNPNDKRQIRCDEKLQKVFKKPKVGAFEMNKFLSDHLYNPEDYGGAPSEAPVKKEPNGRKRSLSPSDEEESDVSEAE